MLGVAYNSTVVVSLLLDRTKYHIGTIERKANERAVKKNGVVVRKIPAYDPTAEFHSFVATDSGGREKVALINGYDTLGYLEEAPAVKVLIFDAAQLLAKHRIEITDAHLPEGSSGVWKLYKDFPKILGDKVANTKPGFTYEASTPQFRISVILERVCKELEKSDSFKRLVAKFIFGMISESVWAEKTKKLNSKVSEKRYNLLMSWLDTFAPDALCASYMDVVHYASERCKKYCEMLESGESNEGVKKRFLSVLDKACKSSNADMEDMLYLLNFVPPDPANEEKFLFPLPPYLTMYRRKYPLVNSETPKMLPE